MHYIARYQVTIGSPNYIRPAHRTPWFWIRPEFTPNRSTYATRFDSRESALAYVRGLAIPGLTTIGVHPAR